MRRGRLEFGGNRFVEPGGASRSVPDAALWLIAQHIGQRGVDSVALCCSGSLAHGRAHERVAEPNGKPVGPDEALSLSRREII